MQIGAAQAVGGGSTGYHRWRVAWHYQYKEGPTGCTVADLTIDLSSTITLPEWEAGPETDPSLVANWNEFITNLRHHEYCHRNLAYQQANEIYREFRRERWGSCGLLKGNVDHKGRTILEKYKQLNEEYDRASRGYITWPPRVERGTAPECPGGVVSLSDS